MLGNTGCSLNLCNLDWDGPVCTAGRCRGPGVWRVQTPVVGAGSFCIPASPSCSSEGLCSPSAL